MALYMNKNNLIMVNSVHSELKHNEKNSSTPFRAASFYSNTEVVSDLKNFKKL